MTPLQHDDVRTLRHRLKGVPPSPSHRDGELIERRNPWTGELVARVPVADAGVVDAAAAAARAAATGWAATPASERAELVGAGADLLAAHAEYVGRWNCAETGRPISQALDGVHAAVATARAHAQLGPLHRGRSLQGRPGTTDLMRHVPRGVVAVLVPWNDPVAIVVQGVTAALVTGNTVVVKTSERAAATVHEALDCFAHLPPGVLSVLHGDATTGRALVDHPEVDVVVLTGSVTAGRDVAQRTAARGARCVLELGGNDPLVVDEDVDPRWAAEQIASGAFTNAGQVCVAVERVYAHRAIAAEVVHELVQLTTRWQPGDPADAATTMGPLVDRAHRDVVQAHVQDAVAGGARLLAGGVVPDGDGAAYPPTVLVDVPPHARMLHEETFGPVVPVVTVDSWHDGLRRAAAGRYGLAATLLTGCPEHMLTAADLLHVGTVKLNDVWGGAPGGAAHPRGDSGNALGYGPELLDELTAVQVVHLAAAASGRSRLLG
jgi:acyl-CoA reductase-like NAD-dependent aldehyde dehydrogenase